MGVVESASKAHDEFISLVHRAPVRHSDIHLQCSRLTAHEAHVHNRQLHKCSQQSEIPTISGGCGGHSVHAESMGIPVAGPRNCDRQWLVDTAPAFDCPSPAPANVGRGYNSHEIDRVRQGASFLANCGRPRSLLLEVGCMDLEQSLKGPLQKHTSGIGRQWQCCKLWTTCFYL
jgi:hypothetical protein